MKWIGGFLIIVVSFLFGHAVAEDEGRPLKACNSLILLFKYMKRRIVAERIPIWDIFSEFKDDFLESIGFLKKICSKKRDISHLWSEGLELLPIYGEAKDELLRFGRDLGALPLDEQIKRINSSLEVLESLSEHLKEELPKKQKSVRTLCLLFGALTVIILI